MHTNAVTSPGQKNTVPVPKTGVKPPVGYAKTEPPNWWDVIVAKVADFYPDETVFSTLTGKVHADRAKREGLDMDFLDLDKGVQPWMVWTGLGIAGLILIVVVVKR